jgi:hypothetical protein
MWWKRKSELQKKPVGELTLADLVALRMEEAGLLAVPGEEVVPLLGQLVDALTENNNSAIVLGMMAMMDGLIADREDRRSA